jgi:biotin transport system substrate-specific component
MIDRGAGTASARQTKRRPLVRDLTLAALFAALTIVGAMLRIPVPPVPFTLQVLVVLLAGMLLGSRLGAMSQVVYLVLGIAGLPVFAAGGGPQYVFTPGFGYVLGFIAAAATAGAIAGTPDARQSRASFARLVVAGLAGLLACYAVALPYFYWILNSVQSVPAAASTVISRGFLVFLPWDLVKVLVAAGVARRVRPLISLNWR